MKKTAIGLAAAAIVLGLATPVSAGTIPTAGSLVITPDPVEQGGSTVITPAEDDEGESICEGLTFPAADPAFDVNAEIWLEVVDPDDETIVDEEFETEDDGTWSYEVEDLTTLGEYTVYARCHLDVMIDQAVPATEPDFVYAIGTFEVIAQATTTTTAAPTTTVAPTTTTAATAAVTATPSYTG